MFQISDILLRILLAVFLGGLIGLEREYTQKSAGLRTHILVTLGATLFTIVSISNIQMDWAMLSAVPHDVHIQVSRDPSRVMAQIVSGIGFIGGGAVLRYGATVRGLTTAADLWAMASIGMLVGTGQYLVAGLSTCVIFLVLFTIGAVERTFFSKHLKGFNRLKIQLVITPDQAGEIQHWIDQRFDQSVIEAKTSSNQERNALELNYTLSVSTKRMDVNDLSRKLSQLEGVKVSTVRAYHETEDMN